jgi:hypothetical protein
MNTRVVTTALEKFRNGDCKQYIISVIDMWHASDNRTDLGFSWKNLLERNHLEDLVVDGNIKLYCKEMGWEGVNQIHWAQIRYQ